MRLRIKRKNMNNMENPNGLTRLKQMILRANNYNNSPTLFNIDKYEYNTAVPGDDDNEHEIVEFSRKYIRYLTKIYNLSRTIGEIPDNDNLKDYIIRYNPNTCPHESMRFIVAIYEELFGKKSLKMDYILHYTYLNLIIQHVSRAEGFQDELIWNQYFLDELNRRKIKFPTYLLITLRKRFYKSGSEDDDKEAIRHFIRNNMENHYVNYYKNDNYRLFQIYMLTMAVDNAIIKCKRHNEFLNKDE
jgi:hypothetical protein